MKDLTLCKKCRSYVNKKCSDYFEPGVCYACVNYLEKKENADKSNNPKCRVN